MQVSYVDIPSAETNRPSGSFSLAVWVNPDQINTTDTTIVNKGTTAYDYGIHTTEDGFLEFYVADLTPQKITGPIPPVGEWTYVVGVYDAGAEQIKLFVNGVLVASVSVTGSLSCSTQHMTVSDATKTWDGMIDTLTIWTRALSDYEVGHYFGDVPRPIHPPHLPLPPRRPRHILLQQQQQPHILPMRRNGAPGMMGT